MDINISAYKADQLGLPKSQKPVKAEMGQAASREVRRRWVRSVLEAVAVSIFQIYSPRQQSTGLKI